MPEETFQVVQFEGTEGVSRLYQFDIMLVSEKQEIDFDKILEAGATFRFETDDKEPSCFSGVLSEFEQLHSYGPYAFFRAVLVPRLWWSTQSIQNQVFIEKTTPQIFETILYQSGLTSEDFEFRLMGDYSREWEFVCQYRESHYQFISRWMEWEGMYYFFEHHESGEKLIITDTRIAESEIPETHSLRMIENVGQEPALLDNLATSWTCRQKRLPQSVKLKDYNYRHPALDVSGEAGVDPRGVGDVYLYGEHIQSPEEAERLAGVRAEEISCRVKRFYGRSRSPFIRAGSVVALSGHYRSDFNSRYLIVEIEHKGHQAHYLVSGLRAQLAELEQQPAYINRIKAAPDSVQYRPRRRTEKPRIYGVLSAHVDGAGSGQYAELDEQGRYKVILPFDLSGRRDGKASTWLRMAQPYAGTNHGMHFPLHKGAEVLLTFIDGDPDRPVISGAVPNPEHPSPVHAGNVTRAGFQTDGGGSLHFENRDGKQRIVMHPGDGRSHFSLGKGSGAEHITSSDHSVQFSAIGASTMSGLFHTLHTYSSFTQVTGFKKAQLMAVLVEELIASLPELAAAAAVADAERRGESSEEATESDAVKWAEGIGAMAGPFLMLISEMGYLDILGKAVEKYFENTNKLKKDLADKPAFFVGHIDKGTVTQLNKSGKNIIFGTSEGDIHSFASKSVVSSGKRVELNAGDEIELVTRSGLIKLHCVSSIDPVHHFTSLDMKTNDTEFVSKTGSIFPNKTTISFKHNTKGPKNTIETEGISGTTEFAAEYSNRGPKVNYKISKDNTDYAQFDVGYSTGENGMATTVQAGKKFDLSGETVTLTSKSGRKEKAKVELKTDGSVFVAGRDKVVLQGGGRKSVIANEKTTKIGELTVKN